MVASCHCLPSHQDFRNINFIFEITTLFSVAGTRIGQFSIKLAFSSGEKMTSLIGWILLINLQSILVPCSSKPMLHQSVSHRKPLHTVETSEGINGLCIPGDSSKVMRTEYHACFPTKEECNHKEDNNQFSQMVSSDTNPGYQFVVNSDKMEHEPVSRLCYPFTDKLNGHADGFKHATSSILWHMWSLILRHHLSLRKKAQKANCACPAGEELLKATATKYEVCSSPGEEPSSTGRGKFDENFSSRWDQLSDIDKQRILIRYIEPEGFVHAKQQWLQEIEATNNGLRYQAPSFHNKRNSEFKYRRGFETLKEENSPERIRVSERKKTIYSYILKLDKICAKINIHQDLTRKECTFLFENIDKRFWRVEMTDEENLVNDEHFRYVNSILLSNWEDYTWAERKRNY